MHAQTIFDTYFNKRRRRALLYVFECYYGSQQVLAVLFLCTY